MKRMLIRTSVILLLFTVSLLFCAAGGEAATQGEVNTDGLNVRTGAGTNFDILKINGSKVQLNKGTKVTITGETDGEWYKIKFSRGGKTNNGYVASMYVSVLKDKSVLADNLSIRAKVALKTKVQKKPSLNSSALTYNDDEFKLKKDTALTITQVRKKSGIMWYGVLFKYKNENKTGYIRTSGVQLKKDEIKAYVTNKTQVYTKAGNLKKVFKFRKKSVSLKADKKVKVLKEKTVKKTKWFYIRFLLNGKTLKGWVDAGDIMFVSGSRPVQAPSDNDDTTPDNAAPLSDEEFEAAITAENFPDSYKPALRLLHASYPLWSFKAYNTGLDWNACVERESAVGKSLIYNSNPASWKSAADGAYDYVNDKYIVKDGTSWVCASQAAVAYYMDPRNFLTERTVFMFESLSYEKNYQTAECVAGILGGTVFDGASYTYTDDDGNEVTKTYLDTFMEAAQLYGISPVHLASRMKQEVVTGKTTVSNSVTGTVAGYEGIYNFYNIGASDSSTGQAVINGLKFASTGTTYMRPWNNQYKALLGGAQYIAGNYVAKGQNTLYLERFNVTPNNTYEHQYMTNVSAAYAESLKTYQGYEDILGTSAYMFSIPVYDNMPETACAQPSGDLNPNNYLRSISVSGGITGQVYEPQTEFNIADGGVTEYVYNVPATEMMVNIGAEAVNAKAVIAGTGTFGMTGEALRIQITVTAEDGSPRIYSIVVNPV